MFIRLKYIESLFCAIITELNPNNEDKSKLYKNLCNAINKRFEGIDIVFDEINFNNNTCYDFIINEYSNCFNNKLKPFSRDFEVIREIGFGGYGKVFEVKSLLDNEKYAIKKTYPKSKKIVTNFSKMNSKPYINY